VTTGRRARKGPGAPKTSAGAQTVSETEFKLNPSDPRAEKGVVNFSVTNDGKVTHSLEVEGPGWEVELGKALQPGQSGMRGEITVGDGNSAGGGGTPRSETETGGGPS
jgi:hypothetical protein